MEFLNYRIIKSKLKKGLFKKPDPEHVTSELYHLARQLDDHKAYAGLCHLLIASLSNSPTKRVGAFLNAARAISSKITSRDDQTVKTVTWAYQQALIICDMSLIEPICLEMGLFYKGQKMYLHAAEYFKRCMSIDKCVECLILCKSYDSALEELRNCPSHLMTLKEYTTTFLLELLLTKDIASQDFQSLVSTKRLEQRIQGTTCPDDRECDLSALLESMLIYYKKSNVFPKKIRNAIVDKLCAHLNQTQVNVLMTIIETK